MSPPPPRPASVSRIKRSRKKSSSSRSSQARRPSALKSRRSRRFVSRAQNVTSGGGDVRARAATASSRGRAGSCDLMSGAPRARRAPPRARPRLRAEGRNSRRTRPGRLERSAAPSIMSNARGASASIALEVGARRGPTTRRTGSRTSARVRNCAMALRGCSLFGLVRIPETSIRACHCGRPE